jgi:hypothetical protein
VTDLKLCKDCKWYKKDWFDHLTGAGDGNDRCLNPVVSENLVTGKVKDRFCDMMRRTYGGCGEEGKYFEPKRTP